MESEAAKLAEDINAFSAAFDRLCRERHEAGAQEYGPVTFLGNDVIRMMMEELADTANYCRMQFVKLMMLQREVERTLEASGSSEVRSIIGRESFKGASEIGWEKS